MDVSMPCCDGIEAAREITGTLKTTRVVMLTGINDLEVSLRARAAGATAYVIKGCSFDELLSAIRAPVTVAPAS